MKILQVTTFFHPVVGGVETHVLNLSKELLRLGHKVTVLTSDSKKNGPRISEKVSIVSGIHVKRFKTFFSLSYFHKFFPGILFYLVKADFDLIHVHGFRKLETYAAMLIAKLRKKKLVLTTHNPFPVTIRSLKNNLLIKLHDWTLGKLFTRFIDKIITLLPSEQNILKSGFYVDKKRLITIPNGNDDIFYQAGNARTFLKEWSIDKSKWKGLIVSVARINYVKGLQNLEQAVKELHDVLFFFAGGDDGYLTRLKVLFAECNNVIFTEYFLSQKQLIDLYAAADVFVLPSLHEPFGIVLLEALAQGCPVISANTGGPGELLSNEFADLLPPKDQNGWKQAISDLIRNPHLRQKMGKKGQAFVQEFKWDKIAKQ